MTKLLLLTLLISSLFSQDIKPFAKYKSSGAVVDIIVDGSFLYSTTTAGIVDIFDIKTKKIIKKIKVDKIKDFMGDMVEAKIFSIDKINKDIMVLSQGVSGYSRVYINNKILIHSKDSLAIIKAKYLDKNTLLLALLSNEIISYDIKIKKENWRTQASGAKFSDFVLSEKKNEVVIADESGELKIIDTKNGKITKVLKGQNLDNVFQVDYKNGIIATAGQDRRAVIYAVKFNSAYYKKSDFLIYSVGLSPSGKLAGYASDENNNVTVFDTITQKVIGRFTGNRMTLTNILFLNEKEFFVASDDRTINLYKIQ